MAFSFLRKKPAEKPEEVVTEVRLSDFDSFINSHMSGRLKSISDEAKKIHANIAKFAAEAAAAISGLEKAEFRAGTEYAVINMVKNNYTKRITPVANALKKDFHIKSYSNIAAFRTQAAKLLTELKSSTPKEGVVVSRYFGPGAAKIVSAINSIDREFKSFCDFSAGPAKPMESCEKLAEYQANIEKRMEDLATASKVVSELKARMEALDRDEAAAQERFNEWKASEIGKFGADKAEKEAMDTEVAEIKSRVINAVSFLEAPFKRMQHLTGNRFFASYFENPFGTILSDWDVFIRNVGLMRVNLNEGKIELDKKDRKKVEDLTPKLTDILPFLHKYSELRDRYEQLSEKVKETEAIVSSFQDGIETIASKQKSLEMEIANNLKEMSRIKYAIQERKSGIESGVFELTGKRINLVIPEFS